MKKMLLIPVLLLAATLLSAQGTENFANYPETGNSYQNGSFTGQDGSTWTYWQCRGDVVINAPSPCLGKDRTPTAEVTSGVLQNGCGTLSFDYMQGFSANVNLDVYVNGLLMGNMTSSSQQGIILNSGTITVNTPGDFTLDFIQHDNASGQVAIDNITWTAFGGAPLPEPSNYPTAFAATPSAFLVTLSWSDAVGTQLPTAYLIKASDADNIALPVDGIPQADDPDLSDGSGTLNIMQGLGTCAFDDLESGKTYYFKVFSYTNTGSNINYKTDGTPPSATATTPNIVIINYENFNDYSLGTWSAKNIIGMQQYWLIDSIHGIAGSPCAKMSGYSGGFIPNEDWLISPAMNFELYLNEQLSFQTAANYDGPDLEVLIGNEYDGTGNPNDYEWNSLSATLSGGGWAWTPSGTVNVSATAGNSVYIAFKYTSTDTESKTWELDEVLITGEISIGQDQKEPDQYQFLLYPNPAREQVTLGFSGEEASEAVIVSLLGTEVKRIPVSGPGLVIRCEDLPAGVYFIRVKTVSGKAGVRKFIVE